MNAFNKIAALLGITASLGCFTASADSAAAAQAGAAQQPMSRQQPPPKPMAQPQTTTVNGLQLQPDGGSGPDKTRFNIVSKSEAKKQQGAMQRGGSNSMTSDGTGGGENSSGN